MDTTTIVAIAVAAVFLLILIVWFFSTWNRLINLDENAQNAWNNIDFRSIFDHLFSEL